MDRVLSYDQPYDAVIQAGYGEHGREGLQELLDVPVVDITEAAASTAMYLGHRYSVVTTLDRAVPLIEDRLLLAGLTGAAPPYGRAGWPCSSSSRDPERAVDAIVAEAEPRSGRPRRGDLPRLRRHGRAGAKVRERTGVPVVDGVAAAVTLAESLVRLGLSTSKVRTYAPARPKKMTGWPITR